MCLNLDPLERRNRSVEIAYRNSHVNISFAGRCFIQDHVAHFHVDTFRMCRARQKPYYEMNVDWCEHLKVKQISYRPPSASGRRLLNLPGRRAGSAHYSRTERQHHSPTFETPRASTRSDGRDDGICQRAAFPISRCIRDWVL